MSTFRHTKQLPVNPAQVFAAMEDPARLARWWVPDGFTNTFENFEFKPGGQWRYVMHGPEGKDYPNHSEFVEIVPAHRVRIKHISLPRYDLTITLEPNAEGTLLTWVGIFENETFGEKMRGFLETANEQNLNRLAAELS